jgi:hypothetical protein
MFKPRLASYFIALSAASIALPVASVAVEKTIEEILVSADFRSRAI